jgi:hypothetical protein
MGVDPDAEGESKLIVQGYPTYSTILRIRWMSKDNVAQDVSWQRVGKRSIGLLWHNSLRAGGELLWRTQTSAMKSFQILQVLFKARSNMT